jgi:hypothetical protein
MDFANLRQLEFFSKALLERLDNKKFCVILSLDYVEKKKGSA